MTADEYLDVAAMVLAKASFIDPRAPKMNPIVCQAWADVFASAPFRLSQPAALAAVAEHYATESRSLMPADVVRLARAHQQRPMPAQRPELPPGRWDITEEQKRLNVRGLAHVNEIIAMIKQLKTDKSDAESDSPAK